MAEAYRGMSKDLTKSAAELERLAENKATLIKRVVREYNEAATGAGNLSATEQTRRQREIERVVSEYVQIYKSIRRVRKKILAEK